MKRRHLLALTPAEHPKEEAVTRPPFYPDTKSFRLRAALAAERVEKRLGFCLTDEEYAKFEHAFCGPDLLELRAICHRFSGVFKFGPVDGRLTHTPKGES